MIQKTEVLKRAEMWLEPPFDKETQKEVQLLIKENTELLKEAFYKDLDFGTGGIRGIMGVGTNRINTYTLSRTTQGLSNYLKTFFANNNKISVAIAFDCRFNSAELAQKVANVFSANNIYVYLFETLRPTPELSFSIRKLSCQAGIMITASHNPPIYNGYKVFWADGAQVVPPQDKAIIEQVQKLKFEDISFDPKPELIEKIGSRLDQSFIKEAVKHSCFEDKGKDKIKIVFTPLHGTAITLMPEALKKAGFKNVYLVDEQCHPNGNFPTVSSPNPEEPAALKMALELAEEKDADIVIGTDPDADRLGVAVRNLEGEMVLLNGNQTNAVLTEYLLNQKNRELTPNHFIGSTLVSSDVFVELAKKHKINCKIGLTGFKWIAQMIAKANKDEVFVCGGEESFGFMVGSFVRDKDSITTALLACEIAARAKAEGSSFYKKLLELYVDVGFYQEELISIVKEGITGAKQIKKIMYNFRNHPLKKINNITVSYIDDYLEQTLTDLRSGTIKPIVGIPKSDVLIYRTEEGDKIAVRPSGTEPKIKFYFSSNAPLDAIENHSKVQTSLSSKIKQIAKAFIS